MKPTTALATAVLLVGAAAAVFHLFQRSLTAAAFPFAAHPEVLSQLTASLDDQKALARLDPDGRDGYRRRFESVERTVHRLQVLEHSRDELMRRYNLVLLAIFAATVLLVAGVAVIQRSRLEPRLQRLQDALSRLAEGHADIDIGDRGRDTVGRIAAMIEETSRVMARDRRRLAALRNLSAWQEAARRHAHEMRTPLTSARLELTRVQDLLAEAPVEHGQELRQAVEGAVQELDRLAAFTRQFTSFARLPSPQLRPQLLTELTEELVATYAKAWPNLRLQVKAGEPLSVDLDRDMVRQVLANLCDNCARALDQGSGTVTFAVCAAPGAAILEVTDDGPGIPDEVRSRLFEPYTTTRTIGEGMGLGLAISKKIMLDHGGDLELAATSSEGTTFRLVFPRQDEEGTT